MGPLHRSQFTEHQNFPQAMLAATEIFRFVYADVPHVVSGLAVPVQCNVGFPPRLLTRSRVLLLNSVATGLLDFNAAGQLDVSRGIA